MLPPPKGLEYWERDSDGKRKISQEAPEWAVAEFKKYQRMLNPKPNKSGLVKLR